MSIHYNAFISYRHHPQDIQVADQIHKKLEHYKLPRDLKKSTGGITRLFRDQEELPITSNLTEDINQALRNSDFLIVICSTHTKESTWVQREIDLFLTTHDRSHILTVLVDGEPYEVIPRSLLCETQVDPATGLSIEVPIEPLSCDWRNPSRKIRNRELDRLAAPLLGCSFDDLRQRQRRYKRQRQQRITAAAACTLLCFAGLWIYFRKELSEANIQVSANHSQALLNRSAQLAAQSLSLNASGDRLTAIALALEAMPGEDGPYLGEAEYALTSALGVYRTDMSPTSAASLDLGAGVKNMALTKDGSILYTVNENNVLSAWNTEDYQLLGEIVLKSNDKPSCALEVTPKNHILAESGLGMVCCDAQGAVLWEKGFTSFALLGKDTLLTGSFVPGTGYCLSFLDPDTGEALKEPLTVRNPSESFVYGFQQSHFEDENELLLLGNLIEGDLEEDLSCCHILNFSTGQAYLLPISKLQYYASCGGPKGSVLILAGSPEDDSHNALYCIEKESQQILWSCPFDGRVHSQNASVTYLSSSDSVFCQAGSTLAVLKSSDGSLLSSASLPAPAAAVKLREGSADAVLEDGRLCSFDFTSGNCRFSKLGDFQISNARIGDKIYAVSGTHANIYSTISDSNAAAFPLQLSDPVLRTQCTGNTMAIQTDHQVHVLDTDSLSLRWTADLREMDYKLLGFSADGSKLWLGRATDSQEFLVCDSITGEQLHLQFSMERNGDRMELSDDFISSPGHIATLTHVAGKNKLYAADVDTETRNMRFVPLPEEASGYWMLKAADRHRALIFDKNSGQILAADFETEACTQVLSAESEKNSCFLFAGEDLPYIGAVSTASGLHLLGENCLPKQTIETGPAAVISACLDGKGITTLQENGKICRYSLDGKLLSSAEIRLDADFSKSLWQIMGVPPQIKWYSSEDGCLILKAGFSGCILSGQDGHVTAVIPGILEYSGASDSLFTLGSPESGGTVYRIPRYSLEDLISMGTQTLNGFTLTEQQKNLYGLTEK